MKYLRKMAAALLAAGITLAGCSSGQPKEEPAAPEVPEETETPEAQPDQTAGTQQTPVQIADLADTYYEIIAGRGSLKLTADENGEGDVEIMWSSSAFETNRWNMHVRLSDTKDPSLEYLYAKCDKITFDAQNNETVEKVYIDSIGRFDVVEDELTWYDSLYQFDAPPVFRRNGSDSIANPWQKTEDIAEAERIAGIVMQGPDEAALPEGVAFVTYECMPEVFGAVYEGAEDSMQIRKSAMFSGSDLSGDFNTYPKTWTISLKGVSVECMGDGETINSASFSAAGELFYTILFNPGESGRGITPDQLNSLIMSIQ